MSARKIGASSPAESFIPAMASTAPAAASKTINPRGIAHGEGSGTGTDTAGADCVLRVRTRRRLVSNPQKELHVPRVSPVIDAEHLYIEGKVRAGFDIP